MISMKSLVGKEWLETNPNCGNGGVLKILSPDGSMLKNMFCLKPKFQNGTTLLRYP